MPKEAQGQSSVSDFEYLRYARTAWPFSSLSLIAFVAKASLTIFSFSTDPSLAPVTSTPIRIGPILFSS